jgi:hypothetical protein
MELRARVAELWLIRRITRSRAARALGVAAAALLHYPLHLRCTAPQTPTRPVAVLETSATLCEPKTHRKCNFLLEEMCDCAKTWVNQ